MGIVGRGVRIGLISLTAVAGAAGCRGKVENNRPQVIVSPQNRLIETRNIAREHLESWPSWARFYTQSVCGVGGLPADPVKLEEFYSAQAALWEKANLDQQGIARSPLEIVRGDPNEVEKLKMPQETPFITLTGIECPASGAQLRDYYPMPAPFASDAIPQLSIRAGKPTDNSFSIELPEGVRIEDNPVVLMPLLESNGWDTMDNLIDIRLHGEGGRKLVVDSLSAGRQANPSPSSGGATGDKTFEINVVAFLERRPGAEGQPELPEGAPQELPIILTLKLLILPCEGDAETDVIRDVPRDTHRDVPRDVPPEINIVVPPDPFGIT